MLENPVRELESVVGDSPVGLFSHCICKAGWCRCSSAQLWTLTFLCASPPKGVVPVLLCPVCPRLSAPLTLLVWVVSSEGAAGELQRGPSPCHCALSRADVPGLPRSRTFAVLLSRVSKRFSCAAWLWCGDPPGKRRTGWLRRLCLHRSLQPRPSRIAADRPFNYRSALNSQ